MSKDEIRYISFELSLIKDLKKDISKIFNYGIVKYAKTIHLGKSDLPGILYEISLLNISTNFRVMYNDMVFCDDDMDKSFTKDEELELIEDSLDDSYFNNMLLYCQIYKALKFFGLVNGNLDGMIKTYNDIVIRINQFQLNYGTDASVMMSIEMMLNYTQHEKNDREFTLLRGFLAIKSIQGNKKYAPTNKSFVIQRMMGAKSEEVLQSFLNDKTLKKSFGKYSGRYFFDQFINDLKINNFITAKITPRGSRSTYFSTHLNMEDLAEAIISSGLKKGNNSNLVKFKQEEIALKNKISNVLNNR